MLCVGEGRSIHARVAALHTTLPLETWHHPPNRVSDIIQHSAVSIEAITQATAVAKTNRALRAKTAPDGARLYTPGDLIDYHRPTATKDDHGGWNGPYPVIRNEPGRGQLVVKTGSREVIVQYPDARHTLYVEALLTREMGMDNTAMRTVLTFIAGLLDFGSWGPLSGPGAIQNGSGTRNYPPGKREARLDPPPRREEKNHDGGLSPL